MRAVPVGRVTIGFTGFLVAIGLALPAMAATESVLYSFPGSGSGYPLGRLFLRNGSLYGTDLGDVGNGQVFKLTNSGSSWKEKTLATFNGANGSFPYAGLVRDSSGVLYGTTTTGDVYNGGNVFALVKSGGKWVEHTIWAFGGTSGDGTQPECDLVIDKSGNVYGTTSAGGTDNVGTVFELSNVNGVWSESVIHSFGANGDGWEPYAGLLTDGSGTFYGATIYGTVGHGGDGTMFKLFQSRGVWKEKVLYTFTGGADGGEPMGALIRDKNGSLYGTTYAGGGNDEGVVFRLSRSGGKWAETTLHSFDSFNQDGANPFAGLTWGPSGQLYGTTSEGGIDTGPGTVFELTQSGGVWNETILHSFGGQGDGVYPQGGVTLDQNGALYGTTMAGGNDNLGTVWTIAP